MLGTAQLGMEYGVTNVSGLPEEQSVKGLFDVARKLNCYGYDTAPGYGCAEERIRIFGDQAPVTTKVVVASALSLKDQAELSIRNLGISQLDTVLIHDIQNLSTLHEMKSVYKELMYLKDQGKIRNFGASVYSIEQSELVRRVLEPDVIQIPVNPWNQIFIHSGELEHLKNQSIRVQARSLFLQGILLAKQLPENMGFLDKPFTAWKNFLRKSDVSAESACMSFAEKQSQIDHWVLGFQSSEQLAEFFSAEQVRIDWPNADVSVTDEKVINPALW